MLSLAHLDEPALHDRVERSLLTDPVTVLHPREPVTVSVNADLGQAMRLMVERKVGAVLVTDEAGDLVGILTERDFLTKVAGQPAIDCLPVRDFMTTKPHTVLPTHTLAFAIGLMDAGGYRHIPIVEAGKPRGVISVRDVLRHVTQTCQKF
jgi:CBS domain-containing protein